MTPEELIKQNLRILAATSNDTFTCEPCKVLSVSGNKCKVESILSEIIYPEVLLQSLEDTKVGIIVIPAVGSIVLVFHAESCRFLVKYSEVSEIKITDNCPINIDMKECKLSLNNAQTSLYAILKSLYDLLANFKVSTPSGPSAALLPDSQKAVEDFKSTFEKLIQQ